MRLDTGYVTAMIPSILATFPIFFPFSPSLFALLLLLLLDNIY